MLRTLIAVLLALASLPGLAPGAEPGPGGVAADSVPSLVPVSGRSGYVFPSAGDQFRSWVANAAGPSAIAGNLVGASWRQWVTEKPAEWRRDERGFAQRFGTGSLSTAISETSLSLVSAAMRQDAEYYCSPRSGLGARLGHAVAMAFVARNRQGRAVFSPGKTFSPFVGPVVVQTTLYPECYSYADGLRSGAYGMLAKAGWNVVRELVLRGPRWEGGQP